MLIVPDVTARRPVAESKTYLGDGAYAEFDGFAIVFTTENGIGLGYLREPLGHALLAIDDVGTGERLVGGRGVVHDAPSI